MEVLLVNAHSHRRLYAKKGYDATAGFGACSPFAEISTDQIWLCDEGGVTRLHNKDSGRRLYAQNSDTGLTVGARQASAENHDDEGWRLQPDGDGFLIVSNVTPREAKEWHLYAQGDEEWNGSPGGGVGLLGDTVLADQRWYVVRQPGAVTLGVAQLAWSIEGLRGLELVVDERFQNFERWNFEDYRDKERPGVRNMEDQLYQKESATLVQERGLVIEARKEDVCAAKPEQHNPKYGGGWTSASLISKFGFTFGIVEVEAKIDATYGFWPAIWTTGAVQVDGGGWPHSGEIDIMEWYQHKILANVFWGKHPPGDEKQYEPQARVTHHADDTWDFKEFHTWRMLWLRDRLEIWLDGRMLLRSAVNDFTNEPSQSNPMRMPHKLRLNLAVGGKCGGNPGTNTSSQFEIRALRVWCEPQCFREE